jgi:hypothetical protein
VDEVLTLTERYRRRHRGWNVKHFYGGYRRDGGRRSYSGVKQTLQQAGLVQKATAKGAHRKRRARAVAGDDVTSGGSRHEWVAGQPWDLIVTMNDATKRLEEGLAVRGFPSMLFSKK